MARDVNDIVVLGFGGWSDVNALPTLGFGIGAPVNIILGPFCFHEGEYYVPGGTEGEYYIPGGTEGEAACQE
jgi:hypothetical protein